MKLFVIAILLSCCDIFHAFRSASKFRGIGYSTSKLRSTDPEKDYVQTLKTDLLRIAAVTNRGESASSRQRESALDLITQLESMNPTSSDKGDGAEYSVQGSWDLVFTDAQLFESSPFFMTLRELFDDTEKAEQAFKLHRAATNTAEIGLVQQEITSTQLVSRVNLRNGLIPGIPFSLLGEIISTADLSIIDSYTMKLSMRETSVKKSNIPFGIGSLIALASVPVGDLLKSSKGDVPECSLSTFYLDSDFRVTRNKDDRVFVYLRSMADSTEV
jgi:PAP_fibrillin